ncbi:hypothetical protein X777_04744 [Ooceraea biroi]|uniref:Uncharacterized protein n=1 Tax=Ooceraea biroi TaxID=2015173 RepID=A0A026X0W2_OOCBI|nr:hypothetical protein X777_04744 [Ooceraea biroi]
MDEVSRRSGDWVKSGELSVSVALYGIKLAAVNTRSCRLPKERADECRTLPPR